MLSLREIDTIESFRALEQGWNDLLLLQHRPNPMVSWAWCFHWWNVYGKPEPSMTLAIHVWEDDGVLVGVVPLYSRKEGKNIALRWLGTGEAEADAVCGDDLGPLWKDAVDGLSWMVALIHAKLTNPRVVFALTDVSAASSFFASLENESRLGGAMVRRLPGSPCPYLHLPSSIEGFFESLSPNFRSQLRQSHKLWQKTEAPEIVWVKGPDELEAWWQTLTDLHQSRWTQAGKPGVFASPKFTAFHQTIARDFLSRGWLLAGTLKSQGKPLAAMYGLRLSGTIFFYQSGIDRETASKMRPGLLIHLEAIRAAISRGDREYDFLRGSDDYKRRFTSEVRHLCHLELRAKKWSVRAKWAADRMKDKARRIRHIISKR